MQICENGKCRKMTAAEVRNHKRNFIAKTAEEQIQELQLELKSSDYKIIKCYEYALLGLTLPYNAEKLHKERQALRDKINKLEVAESEA